MLDTLRKVTTPELIELHLRPAGFMPRAISFLIDTAIQLCLIFIANLIFIGFSSSTTVGIGLFFLFFFLIFWLYKVLFEVLWYGQTPGKKLLGLVVLNNDGTPISWGASFTRNLILWADFLPMMFLSGMICMLLDREFRRLGDIVAGSIVCYCGSVSGIPKIMSATPIAPTELLSPAMQQTLIAFAERAPKLTLARQAELAKLLPSHLSFGNSTDAKSEADHLLGIANFLIGRHL